MRKPCISLLTVIVFSMISLNISAQQYWTSRSDSSALVADKTTARSAFPKQFKLFTLSIEPLRNQLYGVVNRTYGKSDIISLPNAEGGIEQFEIVEASNFDPALQAKFPDIRSFSGKGITDRYATLKLSISPQGISTMVFRTDRENEFIEPYSADHTVYAVFKSQREKGALPWTCFTVDKKISAGINRQLSAKEASTDGELKIFRLAVSVTAEYSNYFGAYDSSQAGLVLAAINNTITRCNGVYEKDLGVHLNLIAGEDAIIFYDHLTDPYAPSIIGDLVWDWELQATLDQIIGNSGYDIGHLFAVSDENAGNAGCIGCVCINEYKGKGYTSANSPVGDNFDIDFVSHEIAHQLGATHTFSYADEGFATNREVGSGITIMGYAGLTGYDAAPHSLDVFHEISIEQIKATLQYKTCAVTKSLKDVNAAPVVAPVADYTIPVLTPFQLTGSATDPDGDPLTYCWEQDDVGLNQTGSKSVAYAEKPDGPNWLSFTPSSSPTRLFPKLSTILSGLFITPALPGGDEICNIEALSSVARTLFFRLTVRDNHPYRSVPPMAVGQTSFTDMTVTVAKEAGPFQVTSPNTSVIWKAKTIQNITWSVNGTDSPPINCAKVNILISFDGGNTFTMLLADTPNDGSQDISVPVTLTSRGRIKVEAVGNIFFDINDKDFTIDPPPPFTFNLPVPATAACPVPSSMSTNLSVSFNNGFTGRVSLTATGNPPGTAVSFGSNSVIPGSPQTKITLSNTNTLGTGTYNITVKGTANGVPSQTVTVPFIITPGKGPVISTHPSSDVVCKGGVIKFGVTATGAGLTYQWQESRNGGTTWGNIDNGGIYSGTKTAELTLTGVTESMNNYRYRVIVSGTCMPPATSNAAVMTVIPALPALISNPASQTLCEGATVSFVATMSGVKPATTYQWQKSTDGGINWNNIPGAGGRAVSSILLYTMNSVNTTAAGRYRVQVMNACGSINSSVATLTVNALPFIVSQPVNAAICAGSDHTFSVTANGTGLTYQWQKSTNGGISFTDIPNATASGYSIRSAGTGINNYQYRVVVSGVCAPSVISNAAILNVIAPVKITRQPLYAKVCAGSDTSFTVSAAGTETINYQWQVSTNGGGSWTNVSNSGVYAGATTATLKITGVSNTMNNYRFRVQLSGLTCSTPVNSISVPLLVNSLPAITRQPSGSTTCIGSSASFSITATGTGIAYQWQVSKDRGATWNNIPEAILSTYTISNTTYAMNSYRYRVIVSGICEPVAISLPAVLSVISGLPSISVQPVSKTVYQGANVTFFAVAVGFSSWQWQKSTDGINWSPVPGATGSAGSTIPFGINNVQPSDAGQYRVVLVNACGSTNSSVAQLTVQQVQTKQNIEPFFNDPTGKINAPASLSETTTIKDKLFIFPSPNEGRFSVSLSNSNISNAERRISVMDVKGAKIYERQFAITGSKTLLTIDLGKVASGIYVVIVTDTDGNKLAEGKVKVR